MYGPIESTNRNDRKDRDGDSGQGHGHGIDWRRGAATSRSAQDAKRESAKRPQ